jgi:dephospho-CoA kinase
MREKLVIGLAGKIASGKDTVSKYFVKKYGAEKIRFSAIFRQILNILNLPETRENMQDLSTILRNRFGENVLAESIARLADKTLNNLVVIDGIRRLGDVEKLKKFQSFFLIYIDVNQDERYKRVIKRKENPGEENITRKKFEERDNAETEIQIESLKGKADFIINNNNSLQDMRQQIDKICEKIKII